MVGGNKGIIIVARQSSTPTSQTGLIPRSVARDSFPPPLRSGGFSLPPFPVGGVGRKTGRKKDREEELVDWQAVALWPEVTQPVKDQEILISVIFLCRSVHSSCVCCWFVHLSLSKDSLYKTKVKAYWGIRNMVERKCPSLNYSNLGGILEKHWFYLSLSVDLVGVCQINSERYG